MRAVALLAALMLLPSIPAASADLQVAVSLDAATVRAGGTTANATVIASIDCATALARNGGVLLGNTVDVAIEQSGAPALRWSGPAELQLPAAACTDPTRTRTSLSATYIVGLEGNLPALAPQAGTVTASVPAVADPALPAESVQAGFTLAAAAVPLITVDAPSRLRDVTDRASVEVAFENIGNVAVTVEAKLSSHGNYTEPGTVGFPNVEVAAGAKANGTLAFQRPAQGWERQTVTLELTPVAKEGGARGPTLHVEVLFRSPETDENPSPAPVGPLLAVALLALAALARRRR